MIDEGAVDAIAGLTRQGDLIHTLEISGRTFAREPLTEIRERTESEPVTLVVSTLTGLRDYLIANRDELNLSEYMLHVVDAGQVDLISAKQGEYLQRLRWVTAKNIDRFAALPNFSFGKYYGLETFNIALQALFEARGDRERVLQLLGTVSDDADVTREDDGTTQKVTARAGIVLKDRIPVPNPVLLSPFRTFPDLPQQPISPFILRVKKSDDGPAAALFEADGGAWKNVAIGMVAEWLKENVPGLTVLA